jgi:hypothetical protein
VSATPDDRREGALPGALAAPLPAVDDVAVLLRARTQDNNGVEQGTFNEATRPTDVDVDRHIALAYALERPRIPEPCPDWLADTAGALIALAAACTIEKSYYPEQVRSGRSHYDELAAELVKAEALFDRGVAGESGAGPDGVTPSGYSSEWTPSFLRVFGSSWPVDHWPEPENPANWRKPFQPPREPPAPGDLPVGDEPASGVEFR